MTGASGASSITYGALPKWQLALAVGAPVALGLGYMYYRNSNKTTPKSNRGKLKSNSKKNGTPAADKQISIDVDCPPKTTPEPETELEKAQRYKCEGNTQFRIGKYDEAIKQYTKAIDTCPPENTEDLATFYQNRAAAYEQLKKYSAVKVDCTKALELKPRYTKALLRRARALECCNDFESALEDVTAACILESFSNQRTLEMADRVLKQLGKQHAMEHLANKKYIMPSKHLIKNYINSFYKDPVFALLKNADNSNLSQGFAKILKSMKEEKYDNIIQLCTEELGDSEPDAVPHGMEMFLLRATFYLLLGQYETAIKDFDTIINSDVVSKSIKVNAFVKRASSYMHLENPEKSFHDFNMAVELDPECGDIYSHKGLANLLIEKIEKAREDFKKAVDLNPEFEVAYVHKCYADYHYGIITRDRDISTEAIIGFEKAFEKFPSFPDCYILYAQILSETQEFQKADSYLSKAIEKYPDNAATAYVHRGLLQLKWVGDVDKAVEYINHALKLDNKCEFGYETLATIEVQRGNLERAIELFDEALALTRTTPELVHIFGLRNAVKTQLALKDKLGPDIPLMNIPAVS
ncbi:translocase of outer membrane 70 isoform X2 [Nomia melanderi]|uniref:translocase of outer membrane 70 isoform X2 n=1 Tax=Nomia melanderi TaxID=2448451 RepID=UPI0013040F5A|nr:mitochondrial import receptor subunit TOM70 [Nomia melanderi]XP_031848082.1 mitochondrial import receptor subunit TOM70 [Nomia melanderi]XP_031848087.1 mitochondrial import receptor subunit TOM70 [Nomia melanderi]